MGGETFCFWKSQFTSMTWNTWENCIKQETYHHTSWTNIECTKTNSSGLGTEIPVNRGDPGEHPSEKVAEKHPYSGVLFSSPPHKLLKRVIVQQINKTRGPFHCSREETNSEVSWTKLHSAQCELCLIARLVHVSCSSYCHALCTPHRSELCNSHMRSQTQYWHESSVLLFQLFFSFARSSFRY